MQVSDHCALVELVYRWRLSPLFCLFPAQVCATVSPPYKDAPIGFKHSEESKGQKEQEPAFQEQNFQE